MDTPEQIARLFVKRLEETFDALDRRDAISQLNSLIEALTAERQRADEAVAHNAVLREALDKCSDLFSEIRGDWTDPRSECRAGQSVIAEALSTTPAASLDALTQRVRAEAMGDEFLQLVQDMLDSYSTMSGFIVDSYNAVPHAPKQNRQEWEYARQQALKAMTGCQAIAELVERELAAIRQRAQEG